MLVSQRKSMHNVPDELERIDGVTGSERDGKKRGDCREPSS